MIKKVLLGLFITFVSVNAQTELYLSQIDKFKVIQVVDEEEMEKYVNNSKSKKDVNVSDFGVNTSKTVEDRVSLSNNTDVSPNMQQHTPNTYPRQIPIPKEEVINLGVKTIVDTPLKIEKEDTNLKDLLEYSIVNFDTIDKSTLKKEILAKAERENKLDMNTLKTMSMDKQSLKELVEAIKEIR